MISKIKCVLAAWTGQFGFIKLVDSSYDFLFESSTFNGKQHKFTSTLGNTDLQTGMLFVFLGNLGGNWSIIGLLNSSWCLQDRLLYFTIMRYSNRFLLGSFFLVCLRFVFCFFCFLVFIMARDFPAKSQ